MIDRNEAFARDLLAANIAAGNDINNLQGGPADPGILAAAGMGPGVTQPGVLSNTFGAEPMPSIPEGPLRVEIGPVPMIEAKTKPTQHGGTHYTYPPAAQQTNRSQ